MATQVLTVGAGAGTGPTLSFGVGYETDQLGYVQLVVGTTPPAATPATPTTLFTLELAGWQGNEDVVYASPLIIPYNAATAILGVPVIIGFGTDIVTVGTGITPTAGSTLLWRYMMVPAF